MGARAPVPHIAGDANAIDPDADPDHQYLITSKLGQLRLALPENFSQIRL